MQSNSRFSVLPQALHRSFRMNLSLARSFFAHSAIRFFETGRFFVSPKGVFVQSGHSGTRVSWIGHAFCGFIGLPTRRRFPSLFYKVLTPPLRVPQSPAGTRSGSRLGPSSFFQW